jgi:predicted nucleic acid-binding protein
VTVVDTSVAVAAFASWHEQHANGYRALIPRLVELGISGGAAYEALVAATASAAGDTLISCDRRAAQIYERLGVDYRLLG